MLYKSLIYLCFICFSVYVFEESANVEKNDFLPVLKIENVELRTIVDSLVEHEKEMDYYDSNLVFYIDIQHRKSITLLSTGSFHEITKSGNEIGCFTIKNHLFIVSSNCETGLFKKTKCKKKIDFYRPTEKEDDTLNDVAIEIYEDDSYTQWNYRLLDGKLIKLP